MKIKEFFKRWKEGINGITKKQQVKMQIQSLYITLLGVSLGIFASLFNFKLLWWVLIILIGGYYNVSISIIGLIQQLNMLKNIEKLTFALEEVKVGKIKNV
jgi:membrane glycosyltransferase